MIGCLNKNLPEYQSLKNRSGISEDLLNVYCVQHLDTYQRLPHLDELPMVNSRPALEKNLNIRKAGFTTIEDITNVLGDGTTQELNSKINDQFSDLETTLIPMGEGIIVESTPRPSQYVVKEDVSFLPWEDVGDVKNQLIFEDAINKLSDVYGITMHAVTTKEIQNGPMSKVIADDPSSIRAFIYNGEIYINLDTASIDAPIHELLHIFIGSLRFKNPTLYMNLLQSMQQMPDFLVEFNRYKNRTESDVLEEIFVTEFSKRLVGAESAFDQLGEAEMNEFLYHFNRTLDSVLMGEFSVKSLSANELPKMSLRDIARKVHSAIIQSVTPTSLNEAAQHRCYQNVKSQLMEEGKLKQECI